MPSGDSITAGSTSEPSGTDGTYRRNLNNDLVTDGVEFDLVGPYDSHPSGDYLDHGLWDHDAFAVPGWRTTHVRDGIAKQVSQRQPDVILLFVGINDLRNGSSPSATAGRVGTIIDRARAERADVGFLLAQIPPGDGQTSSVTLYNDELASLAASKTTSTSPIHLVDMNSGWDPTVHSYDNLHPNDTGDAFIAQQWAEGLATHFGIGQS